MAEIEWVTVGAGFVGAVIGGGATLVGARWQLSASQKDQREREDRHHKAILRALHDELETIREMYMLTVGTKIASLPAGQPFSSYWPVSHDYFTVFNSNAVFLGHLRDDDLRKALIVAYTRAKGLVDSFRLNNGMVERFENSAVIAKQNPTPVTQQIASANYQVLVTYAATLKEGHAMLEAGINDALRRLLKAGVLAADPAASASA